MIQPKLRANWDLITSNYKRHSILYYDTKVSAADIDMILEERD